MSDPDALADLREEIRAATEAAERLIRDARADQRPPLRPPRPEETPPAGWQQADADAPSELVALARLLEALRESLPPELQQQVTDLIRQVLLVLRALIDWAVNRLEEQGRGREAEVEDIPID